MSSSQPSLPPSPPSQHTSSPRASSPPRAAERAAVTADERRRTLADVPDPVAKLSSLLADAEAERDRARAASDELLRQQDVHELLLAALSDVGEGLLIAEARRPTFVNDALCRMTGRAREELLAMDLWQLLAPEHGALERERFARLAAGAPSERWETALRHDGGRRVELEVVVQSLPELRRVVAVVRDVTERTRGEARLRFLAGASALLDTSLDYAATLQQVARLGIPEFADYGFVEVEEDGRARRIAVHRDPGKQRLVDTIHGLRWSSTHPARRVLRSGEPLLLEDLGDADYVGLGEDPEHLAAIRALAPKSILVAPLAARGRWLGVFLWAVGESGRRFDRRDLEIAQQVARRSALAIDDARLYREAQDAIRARDDFVSIASHELRTPLTGLRLQVQALIKRARTDSLAKMAPEAIARALASMERQTDRLARLLDNLLDVSRVAAGKLEIAREEVDLGALVNDLLERFDPQLTAARTSVVLEADEPVVGRWDRLRVEQVVTNLLSNAIKYAPGQPIEIAIERADDRARLVVRDHGPGIPEEHLAHLFDRFERGAATRATPGLGLGLYITRQIVRAHGGEVRVESTPGEGTTFTVELPRA